MLLDIFEENDVEEVPYKSWVMVDRISLKTITKSTADFVETFAERLKDLQRHDFIAKMQTAYMKQIKEGAMENKVILVADFAENYRSVLQDAAHGFHWNNEQATIHPLVIYHRFLDTELMDNDLKHFSFVIISDCMTHNNRTPPFPTKACCLLQRATSSFWRHLLF